MARHSRGGILTAATCCAALWAAEAAAEPAALHLYGPAGIAAERRVLAVLETPDGACAPAQDLRVEAVDPGVTVSMEQVVGACARWVSVTARAPQESATLRAISAEGAPTATLGLEDHDDLGLVVDRSGGNVVVRAARGSLDADARVSAFWHGGELDLERDDRGLYRGHVPADALVGVVARSGLLVGAALSAPSNPPAAGATAVLMPTGLAIHAGGAPRTAAFLLVTDRRGRPSEAVPLTITSERGRLRGMSWRAPGLAAIQLGVASWTPTIDLTVSFRGTQLSQIELPVAMGWPVEASVEAPAQTMEGAPIEARIGATALDGSPVPPVLLRLRCGGAELEPDSGGAVSCRIDPEAATGPAALLVAGALIDGRFVPLGARQVEIVHPAAPAPPPAPEHTAAAPAPRTQGPPANLRLGWFFQGGFDLSWLRGAFAVGLRAEIPFRPWLHLDIGAQYTAAIFNVDGGESTSGPLDGAEHTAELTVGAGFEPLAARAPRRPVALVLRAGLGAAVAAVRAQLKADGADASGEGFRATCYLSIGSRFAMGRARLDVGLGLRAPLYSSAGTWPDAPLRILLELGMVWGLHV